MDENDLGQRLRGLRREAGMTQREAAEYARITASFVSQVEKGGKSPSEEVLLTLLDAYKVPADVRVELLGDAGAPPQIVAVTSKSSLQGDSDPRTEVGSSSRRRRYEPRISDLRPEHGRAWVSLNDLSERDSQVYVSPDARVSFSRRNSDDVEVQRDETEAIRVKANAGRPPADGADTSGMIRVLRVRRLPLEEPDWRSYAQTTITIKGAPGNPVVCEHFAGASDETGFPAWQELGVAKGGRPTQIAIVTAWHGGWEVVEDIANAERNEFLRRLLTSPELQLMDARMEGGGIVEEGFAVASLTDSDAGALEQLVAAIRHFDQESFFLWCPYGRIVVSTKSPSEGWWHGWRRA